MKKFKESLANFEALKLDIEASKQIKGGCPPNEFDDDKDDD